MKMPSSSSARNKKQVWPPGFRFHPTDEELVLYYLKRKVCGKRLKLDIIAETDVYKWDPEDLPGLSKLKTGDRLWFFFSPRDRKYPNGARSNRATIHGYWKATGKDRHITCNSRSVGLKKTLVFYKGRAPSGIRTDWVMHEYTLDEEELKRCQNVGDYYALYKVYKKSGPGPKNGEQYGAPFKEEDWVDEDCVEVGFNVVEASNLSEPPIMLTSDMDRLDKNLISSVDEIEGLWNSSTEIPDSFHQKFGNEIQSTYFDPSRNSILYTEHGSNGHPVSQQCDDMGSNFDYSQSAASQVVEVPDITSGFNVDELNDFLADGDFLEANDLLGPEPVPSGNDNTLENLRFDDAYDGLGEWDLYNDASMFLPETTANDLNSVFNEDNGMVKYFKYQVQPQLDDASFVTSELWEHQNLISGGQSGSVNGVSTSFTPLQDNQNDSSSLPQNRVTSALWAFVESIPTTPASASENILFSQALERVSSFRRTRLSSIKLVTAAGTEDPVSDSKSRSVILFSIIGAVCAMLWVLFTRTSVPVL
ncbi:unnamed protein product [Rhodiola kirilowii]